MLPTPCFIIGDAHLGVASAESERELLAFLRMVGSEGKSLVIMGDLFDFWFAWRAAMPRTGFRVLAALADLSDGGIPVLWLGGNHDCWGGKALQEETGVSYTLEAWRGSVGPWRALLAHGDGLREREDASYRRLRSVLRHPWAVKVFGWLHPNLSTRIAMKSSHTSRSTRARDGGAGLLAVATGQLSSDESLDLVVHGHSHVPVLQQAGAGVYANAGAWYLDGQYLLVDDEAISLLQWSKQPVSAQGDADNGCRSITLAAVLRKKQVG